jgi:hypothetical protein
MVSFRCSGRFNCRFRRPGEGALAYIGAFQPYDAGGRQSAAKNIEAHPYASSYHWTLRDQWSLKRTPDARDADSAADMSTVMKDSDLPGDC